MYWLDHVRSGRRVSAETLLKSHRFYFPPVDVRALAALMGVEVLEVPKERLGGLSGVIRINKAPPAPFARCYVAAEDSPTRRRFTVAHELAHVMLHARSMGDDAVAARGLLVREPDGILRFEDRDFSGSEAQEAQANGYAANLLVPLWMLARERDLDLKRLARHYQVSEEMMRIRLRRFGGEAAELRGDLAP